MFCFCEKFVLQAMSGCEPFGSDALNCLCFHSHHPMTGRWIDDISFEERRFCVRGVHFWKAFVIGNE
jgi:hypothetical protein